MKRPYLALLTVVAPLLGVVACEQVINCTTAGCGTILSITIEGPARDLPPAVYDIELTVDGVTLDASCELVDGDFSCDPFDETNPTGLTAVGTRGENDSRFILISTSVNEVDEEDLPQELYLSVWQDGNFITERRLEPDYETYYPNNEQCGPQCERAQAYMPVVVQ